MLLSCQHFVERCCHGRDGGMFPPTAAAASPSSKLHTSTSVSASLAGSLQFVLQLELACLILLIGRTAASRSSPCTPTGRYPSSSQSVSKRASGVHLHRALSGGCHARAPRAGHLSKPHRDISAWCPSRPRSSYPQFRNVSAAAPGRVEEVYGTGSSLN